MSNRSNHRVGGVFGVLGGVCDGEEVISGEKGEGFVFLR